MSQHKKIRTVWDICSLPFVYTTSCRPTNSDLPDVLPFSLGVDDNAGYLVQMPNSRISEVLKKAYMKGSMITGFMDDGGLGRKYADDFLGFLVRSLIGKKNIRGMRVLELGCGTGYLLSRLKELGADVLGVEPGPHGIRGGERFNVPIIHGFFPNDQVKGKYDLILGYGLIEHVED
ncbi:MAG: class I SAM-dependent methyltransferase, partial [Waddliaceae bacterium]